MTPEQLKPLLHRDKVFLKELFISDSAAKSKRILTFASDSELNTLCKYLHFLSNGAIKIKKVNFENITSRKMSIVKSHFESKKNFQNLNLFMRKDKLKVLLKLVPCFSDLLNPLFVE